MVRGPLTLAAVAAVGLGGCVTGTGTSSEPPVGGGDVVEGKLSNNGLVLDPDALGALTGAPLGAGASAGVVELGAAHQPLAASEGGLELLAYLALCGLDEGTELDVDGARFAGLYGLAPAWAETDCDLACQRWVSACVLAHANYDGTSVPISIRGAHPGLVWTEAEIAAYPEQEAAFYGNLFAPSPELYACAGRALRWSVDVFTERLCAIAGLCGIAFTGECHAAGYAPGELQGDPVSSCRDDAGETGFFTDCRVDLGDIFFEGPTYDEVVTVYLR